MISCFRAKLGYKSASNIFILLNNLAFTFKILIINKKKLNKDLVLGCITEIQLIFLFICLFLGLVSKYNSNLQKIYYLSYFCKKLINNYIPDTSGKFKYTHF